jgi:hypothetical protein
MKTDSLLGSPLAIEACGFDHMVRGLHKMPVCTALGAVFCFKLFSPGNQQKFLKKAGKFTDVLFQYQSQEGKRG